MDPAGCMYTDIKIKKKVMNLRRVRNRIWGKGTNDIKIVLIRTF